MPRVLGAPSGTGGRPNIYISYYVSQHHRQLYQDVFKKKKIETLKSFGSSGPAHKGTWGGGGVVQKKKKHWKGLKTFKMIKLSKPL